MTVHAHPFGIDGNPDRLRCPSCKRTYDRTELEAFNNGLREDESKYQTIRARPTTELVNTRTPTYRQKDAEVIDSYVARFDSLPLMVCPDECCFRTFIPVQCIRIRK